MLFSVGIMSVGTIALGSPHVLVYVVIMGLMGATIPMFNTPATVLIQQKWTLLPRQGVQRIRDVDEHHRAWPWWCGDLADVIKVEWMLVLQAPPRW